MISTRVVLSLAALACAPDIAQAGGGAANNPHLRFSQEYGYTFSEIGAVGNKPVTTRYSGDPPFITAPRGGVDHRYRIMTREVTVGEYLDFARAVAPHIDAFGFGPFHVGGQAIGSIRIDGEYLFGIAQGYSADEPMRTTFAGTVMYANWLHNGKGSGIEAFANGAYDISTFRPMPDDFAPRGQPEHHEDARFWIPTVDEWLKAGYYDPNQNGDGEGGWWEQPNASDEQLIPGRPELGGQTNGGSNAEWPDGQERPLAGGLYPDVQSPWGLIDVSGGASEWMETLTHPENELAITRTFKGTDARGGTIYPLFFDEVSLLGPTATGTGALFGIRLAAAIPAPGGAAVVSAFAIVLARRRR